MPRGGAAGRRSRRGPTPSSCPRASPPNARRPVAPPNFPFLTTYGYHFDAYLVGDYLREVAVARGVERIEATIASVEVEGDGLVAALVAGDGRRIEGELFVDASGFRAAIIEGALGEPHRSFANNLFNDSAVVMPTPVPATGPEAATRSSALSAGWAWHIPLTNRCGNGYVYSSRFIAPDAAEAELRAHAGAGTEVEARHLKMKVGRVERSWVGNCLAVGLAQGFVEPLEATALHVVMATVDRFVDHGRSRRRRRASARRLQRRDHAADRGHPRLYRLPLPRRAPRRHRLLARRDAPRRDVRQPQGDLHHLVSRR